ncbi:MAG: hypothetical protein C5B51_01745 [Terriglobia bacterium]|nr:MAG: hypothetical protein C5B51_01745 [Terriglobia bacterium]
MPENNPRPENDKSRKKEALAEPRRLASAPPDNLLHVTLERPQRQRPGDVNPLWPTIRTRTTAIGFENYRAFLDRIFCSDQRIPSPPEGDCKPDSARLQNELRAANPRLREHFTGVGAYSLLKTATEVFLLLQCGVFLRDGEIDVAAEARRNGVELTAQELIDKLADFLGNGDSRLPYIRYIVETALSDQGLVTSPFCEGVFDGRVLACSAPCLLELIWNYWLEEGMLVQSISAVSVRFQNKRIAAAGDVLATFELDPLRPLSSLLWGYIQDEWNRLTVPRRAYEYSHHYGLTLYGKAVPPLRAADNRSKFIEAFHHLLYSSAEFFKQDDDTTVLADGFALLQALKEVHLILAEGAHNQFGDLPWTARVEMLIQQWLLARPEMRAFLQGRVMVPYTEAWMGQVDAMKRLQNWTDVTVTHFRDLAVFGEQILLSIRYHLWIQENEPAQAANWARYWRPEIQAYVHAYRAATGVDLTGEPVDTTPPSVLLRDRLPVRAK